MLEVNDLSLAVMSTACLCWNGKQRNRVYFWSIIYHRVRDKSDHWTLSTVAMNQLLAPLVPS